MTPKRGRFGGSSLAVFSRNRKHRAIARVELFALWQCCRMLLTLYINYGRGERCRSWRSDKNLASLMARSGRATYSVAHVSRCRRLLEDLGLVRSTYVAPHSHHGCAGADKCKVGHFPSSKVPDVDGGGLRASYGGNVVEVNLTAILSEGPRWEGPLREMGWQDARERCEHDEPAPAAEAPPSGPQLVALDGGRGLDDELEDDDQAEAEALAIAPPAAAEDLGADGGGGIMDDPGGGIMDAHPCDPGSPAENLSQDPGPATSIGPRPRALPGTVTHAHAGMETHDDALEAARAHATTASPSGPRPPRGEQQTNEEQASRQGLGVAAPMDPESLARLRKLCPDVDLTWAAPRVVPLRGGGGSSSSAPPAAPPARSPMLFDDTGPIGRHGERPPGWRPPRRS